MTTRNDKIAILSIALSGAAAGLVLVGGDLVALVLVAAFAFLSGATLEARQ